LNVAVTLLACVTVTVQVPVPLHAPLQPVKVDPVAGVAVNVTFVPLEKVARQVVPQEIPAGFEATVPEPCPCFLIVRM
jgi:hypothetical protein